MRTPQTLDEARKYILYVSDALQAMASSHSLDRQERDIVGTYAAGLLEYARGLEKIKTRVVAKERDKTKLQVVAELESNYEKHKKIAKTAHQNLHIVKAQLKQAEKLMVEIDINEAKCRVAYYAKQNDIATHNESMTKREFEQGS